MFLLKMKKMNSVSAPTSNDNTPVKDERRKSGHVGSPINDNQEFWQKNGDIKKCNKCSKVFSLTSRKKHCRSCGKIFCSECCSHRTELPPTFKFKGKQRVCDDCYFYLVELYNEKVGSDIPTPNYDQVKRELFQQIDEILRKDESEWTLTRDNKGVRIWKLPMASSNIYCFRTTVEINKTPEEVWSIYNQDHLWKNWQPDLNCRRVEYFEDDSFVLYLTYRFPIVENRDSCLYSFAKHGTFQEPNNEKCISLYSRSIQHPKCPLSSTHVRCWSSVGYTTFQPIEGENGQVTTKATSILHIDPRGLIPAFFVNSTLSFAVDSIVVMKEWIEAHAHEYSAVQPTH